MTRTAIAEYARLEATARWRPAVGAERREVIVSLGESSLVLKDMADRPLAHWSLPAVEAVEEAEDRVLLTPGAGEMLEIEDREMVQAIARLRAALNRRPRRLRLGRWIALGAAVVMAALLAAAVPERLRDDIRATAAERDGTPSFDALKGELAAQGDLCEPPARLRSAWDLAARMGEVRGGEALLVLADGTGDAVLLPDGGAMVPEALLRTMPSAEALAARIEAARVRGGNARPAEMAERMGPGALLRYWSTSRLPEAVVEAEAARMMEGVARPALAPAALEAAFAARPHLAPIYAETVPGPDGDALRAAIGTALEEPSPADIDDQTWVALQEMCAG
ncbi:hypothetical protein BCF33_0103 [Hasllibacter halocynthiae]|uniref:Uncharacterized protein n=1 Tax=Hasllibacter halocynthiae TaxID=595589 RepID=A0A2T0X6D1_9RHOB|nr:hypothetical protein [Hasllibacter halocynthiae]PRY94512.1 hypothetical protein BCF33_0103 [Hasllibacter halocynthiae]